MRIWKCDMCGKVLWKDTDVFVVSCGRPMEIDDKATCEVGIESMTCYKEYELCSGCAKKVEKFIRGSETKTCASCLHFDHDEHGPKCKFLKEYLPKSVLKFGCDAYYKESDPDARV